MQTSGLNRDIIDKFYTNPTVSKECCVIIKQIININNEGYEKRTIKSFGPTLEYL